MERINKRISVNRRQRDGVAFVKETITTRVIVGRRKKVLVHSNWLTTREGVLCLTNQDI